MGDKRYSALCGYTEQDLEQVFAPELPEQDREQIRRWYNGYNWSGEAVYNPLAKFEGHYASVFYSQLAALGLNVQPEDITNRGRIDLSLKLNRRVYLFEFKVVEEQADGQALQQLIDRAYAEKYRAPGIEITLIGIEFSKAERNLVGFETLTLDLAD